MVRIAIALTMSAGILFQICKSPMKEEMKNEDIINYWIESVEKIPVAGFINVERYEAVPDPPKTESVFWAKYFFPETANPHNEFLNPKVSYVSDKNYINLISYAYFHPKLGEIRIFEGRNFFILKVEGKSVQDTDYIGIAQETASSVLKMTGEDYTWKFNSVLKKDSVVYVSNNIDVNLIHLSDWKQRIDAVFKANYIYFVTYKKQPSIVGFLNDFQWFTAIPGGGK
jgi:hypothetical protein